MPWMRIEGSSSPLQERELRGSPDGLGFGLIAISVAGLLAMVATWFLVADYPVPDDDAIHLGLLGFFFVVFFDFFLIYRLAGSRIQKGQWIAAAKWSIGLILLGLFVASIVGSLPWLFSRLITHYPWIPWLLRVFFWLGIIVAEFIWVWKARRARNSTRETGQVSN